MTTERASTMAMATTTRRRISGPQVPREVALRLAQAAEALDMANVLSTLRRASDVDDCRLSLAALQRNRPEWFYPKQKRSARFAVR
jgi:hypothetical protein